MAEVYKPKLRGSMAKVAGTPIAGNNAPPAPASLASAPAPTTPKVTAPTTPQVTAPVTPKFTASAAPVASVEQRILTNLNEGWKNAKDKFADRATYEAAYGYANKTPEQRSVLDSFWSSKKGAATSAPAAETPTVPGAGSLTPKAIGVVDKGSQDAFKLPAVVADQKLDQLLKAQNEFNEKALANLEASTSPILAKTREQYAEYMNLMNKAKADNAAEVAAIKDLQANANQEIDINKAGQINAMKASLNAKGITGYAALAAVAQASADPKFITAAMDLKKKYITDLSAASKALNETVSGLLANEANLTAFEAATLKEIRTQKDTLDGAIKDLKKTAVDSAYKPLEDYAKGKTDVAQANDVTNYDVRAEQATWEKSDAVTRKATLQRKLFSKEAGASERGLISNEDYEKASKMASFTEGQAYLESIIASKKQTNALGLTSAANPVKIDQPVGSFSAASVQSVVDRYSSLKTKAERDDVRKKIDEGSYSPEDKAALKKILDIADKSNPLNVTAHTNPAVTPPSATAPVTPPSATAPVKPKSLRGPRDGAAEEKLKTGVGPKSAPIKGENTFWGTKSAPESLAEKQAADAKKAKEEADMKRAVALQTEENMKKQGEDIMNNANRSFYGFEARTPEEQNAALNSMKKGQWYQIQGTRYAMKNNDGNLYIYDPLRRVNAQTMWEAEPKDVLVKTQFDRSGRPGWIVEPSFIEIK